MNKWTVISNSEDIGEELVEFGPDGRGVYHRKKWKSEIPIGFHYEILRGIVHLSFEDTEETSGGIVPVAGGRLLLYRWRENSPEAEEWFTECLILAPESKYSGIRFLSRMRSSEIQSKSLWQDRHDGKAVRAAIEATGSTQEACAEFLGIPVSTFRGRLNKQFWNAHHLAQLGLFLDTDLIGPYLCGHPGKAWVATPDGSGLLRFSLDPGKEGQNES